MDFFGEPSAEGTVVDFARNGERVTVRPGPGDWLQVEGRDGIWRWVPEAQVHPQVPDRPLRVVDLEWLGFGGTAVFSAPAEGAQVVQSLPNGTVVAIVARRERFRLAELPGGRYGWLIDLGLAELAPEPDPEPQSAAPPMLQR